ncbi:MAG: DUF2726 domain-containing protein [Thermomicrobiales bacterium]
MSSSIKQRLLNRYEEVTYDALSRACAGDGAKVFAKVRIADVFRLEKSGISAAEYSYALRAHFDFLVVSETFHPLFSVEFDGPLHRSSELQRRRDETKNALCTRFDHGLLRINSNYLTRQFRGLGLLTYFVDAWFLERAFDEAQRKGIVPYDEPFDMTFIISNGTSRTHWPYWLTRDIQLEIQQMHKRGQVAHMAPSHFVGTDAEGNYRCISWIELNDRDVISVRTGMREQRFPAVCKSDLISMLAMFDLYERIKEVLNGRVVQLSEREAFFLKVLPEFEAKYSMVSKATVGYAQ